MARVFSKRDRMRRATAKPQQRKPRKPDQKFHSLGEYNIPDEAIWLIGDIATLEVMQQLLDRLQERSFVERGAGDYAARVTEARKVLRRLAWLISLLRQLAEKNLVHDFTGGGKIPRRPHRQTIADVWQILLDGFK